MPYSEAVKIIETVDNKNPLFSSENSLQIPSKERYLDRNNKFTPQDQQNIQEFLKKINLSGLNDSEILSSKKQPNQATCQELNKQYQTRTKTQPTLNICNSSIYLYQINEKYLYLNIFEASLGTNNFFNIIYDTHDKKIIDLSNDLQDVTNTYVDQDKIWFMEFNTIIASFDLQANKLHNKSHKWWIQEDTNNLIITSFDQSQIINLGKIKNKNIDDPFGGSTHIIKYFETNNKNTHFAFLEKITHKKDLNYRATIRYGKLEKNGLENSKTFSVQYKLFEAAC